MRMFTVVCKDKETGHTMNLADCSYNEAMSWLQTYARRAGRDVFRVDNDSLWHYTIYTGVPTEGFDMSGNPERFYTNTIRYFYDELRGILMSE